MPNEKSTLAAFVEVDTGSPANVDVHVSGPGGDFTVPSPDNGATQHSVPVLGMRAESTYEFDVEASTDDDTKNETTEFTTGAIPDTYPTFETVVSDPERMAPGWTMFDLNSNVAIADPAIATYFLVAVDEEGEVVWYIEGPDPFGDARVLPNGNLLTNGGDHFMREWTPSGKIVHEWLGAGKADLVPPERITDDTIMVDVDSFHHEMSQLPNGNLLALTHILEPIESDEPLCGEDPADFAGVYNAIGDQAVEVEYDTGEIVNRWVFSEALDPLSDPENLLCPNDNALEAGPAVATLYPLDPPAIDAAHANSVVVDEERNALIVTQRANSMILAVRYQDDDNGSAGELLWAAGPYGDVELEGDGEWSYGLHAPHIQPDGSIMIFDNGFERPDGERSRAVRYEIDDSDPDNVTARQVWEYEYTLDGEPSYSAFLGDADVLENGDVLISGGGSSVVQIVEVAPADAASGGDVVFEYREIDDPVFGIISYRAERIAPLGR